jgi:hypothetical protein
MGRPQFEVVVASAPREMLQIYDFQQNITVPINGAYQVDIFAPAGYIAELNSMWLQAPAPSGYGLSSTCRHTFALRDTDEKVYYTQADNDYLQILDFQQNHWQTYGNANPTTETGIIETVQYIKFDSKIGLRIKYFNGSTTQAITNIPLKIRLIYVLRQVSGVA